MLLPKNISSALEEELKKNRPYQCEVFVTSTYERYGSIEGFHYEVHYFVNVPRWFGLVMKTTRQGIATFDIEEGKLRFINKREWKIHV